MRFRETLHRSFHSHGSVLDCGSPLPLLDADRVSRNNAVGPQEGGGDAPSPLGGSDAPLLAAASPNGEGKSQRRRGRRWHLHAMRRRIYFPTAAWLRLRGSGRGLSQSKAPRKTGFTLLELLVVIAIIGLLTALLFPAFSRGKQRAQGVVCLNEGKQLMMAMTMYAGDNQDYFPPNPNDGNSIPGHNWCSGKAGIGGADEFNPDVLKDPERSLLVSYLNGNVSVFHCPGDKRMGGYQGADPAQAGRQVPSARTFAMNQAVGTICPGFDSALRRAPHYGAPRLSVNGPWLDHSNAHRRDQAWHTYGKLSSTVAPGPSRLWVLMDESPKELNDAAFAFGMVTPIWHDVPGTYHDYGCGFAFADGHSETRRWASRAEKQRGFIRDAADRRDWLWMRERTSAHLSVTMPVPKL